MSPLDPRDAEIPLTEAAAETPALSRDAARALMAARARRLAEPPPDTSATAATVAVLTFALGDERYGIEARYVREVLPVPDITPLCGARAFVLGLSNLRGTLIAMADVRALVGMPAGGAARRAIVLGRDAAEIGLVTDTLCELETRAPNELEELTTPIDGAGRDYLRGITTDGLVVLDASALLDDPELLVEERDERVIRPRSEDRS